MPLDVADRLALADLHLLAQRHAVVDQQADAHEDVADEVLGGESQPGAEETQAGHEHRRAPRRGSAGRPRSGSRRRRPAPTAERVRMVALRCSESGCRRRRARWMASRQTAHASRRPRKKKTTRTKKPNRSAARNVVNAASPSANTAELTPMKCSARRMRKVGNATIRLWLPIHGHRQLLHFTRNRHDWARL